jgi:hypothetical protein
MPIYNILTKSIEIPIHELIKFKMKCNLDLTKFLINANPETITEACIYCDELIEKYGLNLNEFLISADPEAIYKAVSK